MNELIAGKIAAPKDLPADAVGSVGTPNTLPADSAGIVGTPNTVPSDSAGIIAAPISLPSQGAAALPRSLTPMVEFDFAAKRYVQDGVAVAFEDIFTYTRASSATFTNRRAKKNGGYEYFLDNDYVGSVTNTLRYSEDFSDTALWATNGAIITNAAIAPDGTLSADHLQETSISSAHGKFQSFDITAGTYTRSIYAKAAERSWFYVKQYDGVSNSGAWFNLTAGTVGTVQAGMTAAMEPAGDGWFKCSITNTTSASTERAQYGVAANNGAFSYVGTAGLGIYIWGAQFTESAKPLPYVKTLDVAVTKTFAETLRTEYDAVTGKNLGALIEGDSTNLVLRSEEIGGASWFTGAISFDQNSIAAPDGTITATKFTNSSVVAEHYVDCQNVTLTDGTFTSSVYVKKGNIDTCVLKVVHIGLSPVVSRAVYNFSTDSFSDIWGLIGSTKSTKLSNGWVRLQATYTLDSTVTEHRMRLQSTMVNDSPNETVYAWGAQVEREPFMTSYIRTDSATVSRSHDNLHLPPSGNVSFLDSTIHVVFDDDSNPFDYPNIYTHNGVGGNLRVFRGPSGGVYSTFRTGNVATTYDGVGQVSITSTIDAVTQKVYKNGVLENYATTIYPTPTINNALHLYLGSVNSASGQSISGHISKFSTYAQALTQQEITLL